MFLEPGGRPLGFRAADPPPEEGSPPAPEEEPPPPAPPREDLAPELPPPSSSSSEAGPSRGCERPIMAVPGVRTKSDMPLPLVSRTDTERRNPKRLLSRRNRRWVRPPAAFFYRAPKKVGIPRSYVGPRIVEKLNWTSPSAPFTRSTTKPDVTQSALAAIDKEPTAVAHRCTWLHERKGGDGERLIRPVTKRRSRRDPRQKLVRRKRGERERGES